MTRSSGSAGDDRLESGPTEIVARVVLAHGGGGELMNQLIHDHLLTPLNNELLSPLTDGAILPRPKGQLVFTTDSYVVSPLEFPGGDIGKLAICGTVNDIAVAGAKPAAMSMGLIIQEGLEISLLGRLLSSAGQAAGQAGVEVVTGDTKVVQRSACDGLMINTAGVGWVLAEARLGFEHVREGDCVLLSGALGEHGLSVMSLREHLSFTADLVSDCAPIGELTTALIAELGEDVHFLRDPTRGGLAATLAELSSSAGRDIEIREDAIPVNRTAEAAAEMLGLDLLTVANEGKLVAVVSRDSAERAVKILAGHEIASRAAVIGTVGPRADAAVVEMVTRVGGRRIVQMPYGEELPRIC